MNVYNWTAQLRQSHASLGSIQLHINWENNTSNENKIATVLPIRFSVWTLNEQMGVEWAIENEMKIYTKSRDKLHE